VKNILSNTSCQQEKAQYIPLSSRTRRNGQPVVHYINWMRTNLNYVGTYSQFIAVMRTLTKVDREILCLLIHFKARGFHPFMTQGYIAEKISHNRTYISERLNHMMRLGILDIYRRGKTGEQESNVYKLAMQFFDANLWPALDFLPVIRSMMLGFLLLCPVNLPAQSAFREWLEENPTLINIKDFNLYKYSLTDSKSVDIQQHNNIKRE